MRVLDLLPLLPTSGLSPVERHILVHVAYEAGGSAGVASLGNLAAATGYDPDTVGRICRRLVKAGVLEVQRTGRGNWYKFAESCTTALGCNPTVAIRSTIGSRIYTRSIRSAAS